MKPKNLICLWFDHDAHAAATFYAATFPDSRVTAVHRAPSDYPNVQAGEVSLVEFTVLGIPCLGLNGGPVFRHSEAFSFQIATDDQAEPTAIGTRSSATAASRVNAAGARIGGGSRGRSLPAC
jgi:predicted 3-demethylubiquinone-9 3-methyltransferase (glyoxalase superfamily)